MNKKISFLILSTYLTTSVIPTIAFAENANEPLVVSSATSVENKTDMANKESANKELSKVNIKYLYDGVEIHPEDTNKTLLNGTYTGHTEIVSVPETIDGKYPVSVEINGKLYDCVGAIMLALDSDHDDIDIIWHYADARPTIMSQHMETIIHESFFPNPSEFNDFSGITEVFPSNYKYNFTIGPDMLKYLYSGLKEGVVTVGTTTIRVDNPSATNRELSWLKDIISDNHFIDIQQFSVDTSNKQPSTNVNVNLSPYEYEKYFDESNKNTIYAYKIDYKNKKLIETSNLKMVDFVLSENDDKDNGYVFSGEIEDYINNDILYSTCKIDTKTNKPINNTTNVEDATDKKEESTDKEETIDEIENTTENNKVEDKEDATNKDVEATYEGPFGIANARGLGNFVVSYNQYLEHLEELKGLNASGNVNLEESFLPINGTDGLDFYLSLSLKNIENVFKSLNNASDIKINLTENINGVAKKFNDLYKSKITQKVTIESNVLNSFETENIIQVKNNGYVYLVPNTDNGKVVYLGEQTNELVVSSKADLNNMTVFVTSEKIALNEDGSLPDTSGVGPIVMVGGIALVLAGGFIVLGKRKKENK